jgi:beta-ribofuranosylaminobenzene 5'-phosphate synthase
MMSHPNRPNTPVIEVSTPCRLHFGLLALSRQDEGDRQYGGAGVMIRQPQIVIRLQRDDTAAGILTDGPMAQQAQGFAQQFIDNAKQMNLLEPVTRGRLTVVSAPRPHTGLGTGTQLGMAVGQAMAMLAGRDDLNVPTLAGLMGRGRRSAIGAYGFGAGGFIVEGGKLDPSRLSPLLMRHDFPDHWRLVLISPHRLQGLAGRREMQAFATMPDIPGDVTAQMCRLVLMGLAPAMLEGDLPTFGQALYELQRIVGQCFAQAQGGIYADPSLETLVAQIRTWGVHGVGQSSWGPTLYAVVESDDHANHLVHQLQQTFELQRDELSITQADNQGGRWHRLHATCIDTIRS